MRTTRHVAFRTLGWAAAVAVSAYIAGCESAPFEPDRMEDSAQQAGGVWVSLARVIEPSDLGMSNPAGLAFSSSAGALLVVQRVPEAPVGSSTDIELITLAGDAAGRVRIAAGLANPLNMAFNGGASRLLVLESASDRLIEVPAGSDGRLDPQSLRQIDARSFGLENAQGIAVDPASGRLFILDAAWPRLVRVDPHARLGFESPTSSVIDLSAIGSSELRGLAVDPTNGHLHVLDPRGMVLYELSQNGQVEATRDVSGFGLRNPQGMAFGPSGDNTDDPSEMSLYIADSGVGGDLGQITELSFARPAAAALAMGSAAGAARALAMESASLVQTIHTWQFSPPSPDAAGITYVGSLGDFLISDSEVNEMSIYTGANLFQMNLSGGLTNTYTTCGPAGGACSLYSDEPTGITWNPSNNHLFISDDAGAKKVYEVNPGSDGLYNTADDIVTSFATGPFGSSDPEGVTYDSSQGVLFMVDGVNREVYRVSPGSNGLFDGVDDVVTSFDTQSFGLIDPEGIAYDSDHDLLYLVGKPTNLVFHVTTTGTVVRTIDISAADPRKPAGLAYAPSSVNPSVKNLWLAARGTDNDSDPNENDGEVYEFSLPSFSENALPAVTITAPPGGSTFTEGTSITFSGTASDVEDGNLTASLAWISNRDGSIGSGGSFSTSALSTGTHTITASVTDSGSQQASAAIEVAVNPEGVVSLNVRVAAGSDDAEERASGRVTLTSNDLELVFDRGGNQTVGMRFNGLTIPQGATITNASVQFQVDETDSEATLLTIKGQATDNAATFTTASGNISSRGTTASSASWSPVPWTTKGQAGPDQKTPNIASILQEIVNRPGWSSGNSMAIIISGAGHRTAESYNGVPGAAPLLHVEYVVGSPGNSAPTATNVAITGTAQVGQVLTGGYTYVDADGDLQGTSTFRWLRNGVAIPNATATTHALVGADAGAQIVFEVTPVALGGASPGLPSQSAAVGPVQPASGGPSMLEVRVAASSDDAEERASGRVTLTSSDLELVFDGTDQWVGMRFNAITIPRGATITDARVQFQVDEVNSGATSVTIRGQASDNATTFTDSSGNISTRSVTGSSVSWSPVPWTTKGEAGPDQETPNIAAVIQEIVNRTGWSSGNSLAIIITGTGERTAESYNGVPSAAPLLRVTFSGGSSQ